MLQPALDRFFLVEELPDHSLRVMKTRAGMCRGIKGTILVLVVLGGFTGLAVALAPPFLVLVFFVPLLVLLFLHALLCQLFGTEEWRISRGLFRIECRLFGVRWWRQSIDQPLIGIDWQRTWLRDGSLAHDAAELTVSSRSSDFPGVTLMQAPLAQTEELAQFLASRLWCPLQMTAREPPRYSGGGGP